MATHRISIINHLTKVDATGECRPAAVDQEMTLGTSPAKNAVLTMDDPSSADVGFSGGFKVPKNYVGTPKIVVSGLLDGTISTTQVAWQFAYRALADNESIEQAWQETVTFNTGSLSGGSYTDEDYLEDSASLTANFAVDDWVAFNFVRDYSEDTFVGAFHIVDVEFEYADS